MILNFRKTLHNSLVNWYSNIINYANYNEEDARNLILLIILYDLREWDSESSENVLMYENLICELINTKCAFIIDRNIGDAYYNPGIGLTDDGFDRFFDRQNIDRDREFYEVIYDGNNCKYENSTQKSIQCEPTVEQFTGDINDINPEDIECIDMKLFHNLDTNEVYVWKNNNWELLNPIQQVNNLGIVINDVVSEPADAVLKLTDDPQNQVSVINEDDTDKLNDIL